MTDERTISIEDAYMAPFFTKQPVSIDRGNGVFVWDEEGRRYLDFTSGWGVTCLGHASPIITEALTGQAEKIIQNPNSGLTYSPARARLLTVLKQVLPPNMERIFFTNSGAEANDAAIKLARKVTGRTDVISAELSFHGRTISTLSATGQVKHRDKFKPLMPNYSFVPFGDIAALRRIISPRTAAVILEPIQGEGGVRIPEKNYLKETADLCRENGSLLIADEIQTGFCRTGPFFVTGDLEIKTDFLTMAKGIAGGFPFGAFAMTAAVASKIETGDHGGTYCGNPLGCAVAAAVISHLISQNIPAHVESIGRSALRRLGSLKERYSGVIRDIRGKGLLLLIEFADEASASRVNDYCLKHRLFVRQTQGTGIRLFPALNISETEMDEGLAIIEEAIDSLKT